MQVPTSQSFTLTSGALLNVLKTECLISEAFDPLNRPLPPPIALASVALWDTGATCSVVSQRVIDACKLIPIGTTIAHGVNGAHNTETYLINVGLMKNTVQVYGLPVIRGTFVGFDMLVGMDIITRGDFSLTHKDQKTVFSFRCPSMHHVDYVKEHQLAIIRSQQTHGSGSSGHHRPQKPGKSHGKHKK